MEGCNRKLIHDARLPLTATSHYPGDEKKAADGHVLLFEDILVYFIENKKAVRKRTKAEFALQGMSSPHFENLHCNRS